MRRAFTLIELLTVISIIAILAALLLPVFFRARETSRQTACLSNQKQLATAVSLYVQDYDETLPSFWDNAAGDNQPGGWVYYCCYPNTAPSSFDPSRGSLFPYLKNAAVFTCPSDPARAGDSYAINALIGGNLGTIGVHPGLPYAALSAPASTFLFVEERQANGSTDDAYLLPPFNLPTTRHNGGSIFSFCDGHAKWLRPESISYPNPTGTRRYEP